MAQTALEMFAESLRLRHKEAYNDLYEDLETYYKKIEKEQIEDAYWDGGQDIPMSEQSCQNYYENKFGRSNQ